MITKYYKYLLAFCVGCGFTAAATSCSDFIYDDSDQVTYADKSILADDADTLWAVAGIMNKMQVIADRTILLGEVRGDLVSLTTDASSDLRQLADFTVDGDNKYNQPRDYYAVINNCNYFLAHADTTLRNSRNERIFIKEYAAVKAFRAWTYLQLALNYGRVPFITTPILSLDDADATIDNQADLAEICRYFIADLTPLASVEMPGYGPIRSTDSRLFYYPINVLLGDLYLWSGQYREAAQSYYRYISSRNGTNSAYPLSTDAVRFMKSDSRWMSTSDSWSPKFSIETGTANSELITMIPGDSIPSEGNYSQLRDLFNTNENNDYRSSIVPSPVIIALSAAQKYCHYTTGGEYIAAPEGLDGYRTGDLRLQATYTSMENGGSQLSINGKRITNYSVFGKYQTRNVHILRRSMVYLRMAEALNRAGFPRFAFQILKTGLNNSVIQSEVLPYYPADSAFIASFNFPNNVYILETTAGLANENTMGIHSRGSGYSAANGSYAFLEDSTLIGTPPSAILNAQIEYVEDLIVDEGALECAFEGQRFYDLMRVAMRRGDNAYLASRVARRSGVFSPSLQTLLMDASNWRLKIED
ncbi:MAG: RagB/SusD family nutrient uptake outer membrane protein [Prevotella sp.]|nr:RagB/SusD family nutrient uptake outer membrane protein [Prevotella sp.]